MTTPLEALNTTFLLPEDEQLKIRFTSDNKLASFRVRLYKEKRNTDKFENIQISRKRNLLILYKGIKDYDNDNETSFEIVKKEKMYLELFASEEEDGDVDDRDEDLKKLLKSDAAKDYNVISGKRANTIHKAMNTLFKDETAVIIAKHQELLIELSLNNDLSEEEKKLMRIEIAEAINIEHEEITKKKRKIIQEAGF